ncbi:SDR family oxidoreductase [Nocardiopsis ganjiahuensis]|uniref:SDR family oxidoreductase n=1 Tax=Nocardiopsis ganjiahuensis TaxID=239984 RepID=UPI000347CB2B|nr:SDR family oxidoreductase [Nocardiopsis ganjiahuensis]
MTANEAHETPPANDTDPVRGTVLVSGATGGIGTALVDALVGRGWAVAALGRDPERLAGLSSGRPRVHTVQADLRHPASLAESVAGIGDVDAFVHCAGISPVASVEDSPVSLWQEVLAVNLISAAELTRLLLPALRASAGHVVLVNASPGLRAVPLWSAFAASKAGLSELAGSLREEEGPHGVRVTSVHPGGTATELLREVRGAFGRDYDPAACIQPATLARAVVNALELPRDAQITELHLRPGMGQR